MTIWVKFYSAEILINTFQNQNLSKIAELVNKSSSIIEKKKNEKKKKGRMRSLIISDKFNKFI